MASGSNYYITTAKYEYSILESKNDDVATMMKRKGESRDGRGNAPSFIAKCALLRGVKL